MVSFVIPGEPQGKARARTVRRGNFTTSYTPEKTVNYEALVKQIYTYEAKGPIYDGPVSIKITAYYDIPKSTSKKKAAEMLKNSIRPTKKPDFDNIAKIISDALNGIAYKDDTQIVEATFGKYYSDIPRVEVVLQEVK